jgi:hypothetical protein
MSGLDILGGIGQGLMQGSQFVANERQRKDAGARQDEVLQMQRDMHTAKMDEVARIKQEQETADWMGEQYRTIYAREDLDDYGKATEYAKTILPRAKPEQIDLARKTSDALYQQLGVKGVDALARGDISTLQRLADAKAPGTQVIFKDGVISVSKPDGSVSQIDRGGLISMLELSKASETLASRDAAALDREAKIAKIQSDRALAAYRGRMPQARIGGVGGGSGGRRGSGGAGAGGKEFDAIGTLKDYADAFKGEELGEEGASWDKARGLEYFGRIRTNNPQLMNSEAGQLIALTASREIAKGNGRLAPTIGRDGGLAINAQVGANLYTVESGVSEARLMQMTGLDGKPLAAGPEDVGKMYLEAIQNAAQQEPEAFNAAVVASRTPEVMQKAREAAARGDAGAIRTLQLVPAVARANQYTQTLPVEGAKNDDAKEAPVAFTDEERAAASKYKVQDVDRTGAWDRVTGAAGAVADAAKGVLSAADENFVKNTRAKINSVGAVDQGDALAIVERLRGNPALKDIFSEQELWAIQMAANQRI